MADTPQEQNNDGNNQEFRKYYILFAFAVIAFNMLIVCLLFCVVFFMPWKEITFKLQDPGVDAKVRVILENSEENVGNKLDTQILEELSTKLNNVEESIHKEVKSEVAKLEQQLNFQKGCNDDEDTRIYYDDDLKKQMVALENLVTSQETDMRETINIEIEKNKDNLMQKLTEFKDIAHPFEELKLKVAKIESERLQSFCESDKGNCIVHTDDLEKVVNELEKHVESKIQTKIDEVQKLLRTNYNDKDQMKISDIEKNKEETMKKSIEQSSINYEIEQKLDEFENFNQQDIKNAETDENEKTTGTTSYIRITLKVLVSSVRVMIFIFLGAFIRNLMTSSTALQLVPKISLLIICVSVMVGDVYLSVLFIVYGQDELFRVFACVLALRIFLLAGFGIIVIVNEPPAEFIAAVFVYSGILLCLTVMLGDIYLLAVYMIYGQDGLVESLLLLR